MKTYKQLINEATLFSSPFRFSAIRGVAKAVEDLARDVVYSGVKFVVKHPNIALAGAIAVDSVFGFKGTKALAKYFEERFPGHAMNVYNKLVQITVDNDADEVDVGNQFQQSVESLSLKV